MNTTTAVINSPLFVALASVAATALVTLTVAAVKMIIQLARVQSDIQAVRQDIADIKTDPDVMRWSNYGRAVRAMGGPTQLPGGE